MAGATSVAAAGDLPGYCRVTGVIEPGIQYEARLPLADWNGKYYQSGCGGYCGSVLPDKPGFSNTINEALKLGFAAITTDNGHQGDLGDASWAAGNPEAVRVYAYRGIELAHRFGMALTRAFYRTEPRRRYFGGCSNGGRMAAMAAQRYPQLFDGILGGAAVLNLSQNGGLHGSWVVQSNTRADGSRILTRANFARRLPWLESVVKAQCDRVDGREDGVISQPRSCALDLAALPACAGDVDDASTQACVTDEQREVLRRWYGGARDSSGRQLYPGVPPGSERYWLAWFLDPEQGEAPGNALGGHYARYLGFPDDLPPDWTALDFDFDADPPRLARTAPQFDALDPDLRSFSRAGGKLLMWHGWADPLVLPDQVVDYYERVVEQVGGLADTRGFFRLFMIPGHGHCWELPAASPDQFNPIRMLDDWVERGAAPEVLLATSPAPREQRAEICPYPSPPAATHSSEASGGAPCAAPD